MDDFAPLYVLALALALPLALLVDHLVTPEPELPPVRLVPREIKKPAKRRKT